MIPRVLSIAGTDPTGGAGIHADIKSISAAGGYAMAVVTALVAQNTQGVRSVHTPPCDFLAEQLTAVSDDVTIDAIKIGMLGDADTINTVSAWIPAEVPVVLDPVMVATSGDRLLDSHAVDALRELCAHATAVTPNLQELAVLCNTPVRDSFKEACADARAFAQAYGTTVIVKGGHLTGPKADNAVVTAREVTVVESMRVTTRNTHGTGCSLSAALATRLGAGDSMLEAVRWATEWLHGALRHADELKVGAGNGPVNHFWNGIYS